MQQSTHLEAGDLTTFLGDSQAQVGDTADSYIVEEDQIDGTVQDLETSHCRCRQIEALRSYDSLLIRLFGEHDCILFVNEQHAQAPEVHKSAMQ